ncbi:MAG: IclR family transcriptional regulator [Rhizobiaceae bacterium]|nr:IclR family transcriptional regulator [Rhizobiaceae bacterium]
MVLESESGASDGLQGSVFGLLLIEYLADQARPLSLTEISTALTLGKSRVFRHLQTLVANGFLVQDQSTDRYSIGPRSLALGISLERGNDLLELALPVLKELRDTLGHTTVISQSETDGVRVLATVTGRSMIEIGVRRGSLLALHATAQGKVALAFGEPDIQRVTLRQPLERLTPYTIVDPLRLKAELRQIEEQGWASAFNEIMVGLNTLAAPVRNAEGKLIATLAVVDSIQMIAEEPSAKQIRETTLAALHLSERLGFRRQV